MSAYLNQFINLCWLQRHKEYLLINLSIYVGFKGTKSISAKKKKKKRHKEFVRHILSFFPIKKEFVRHNQKRKEKEKPFQYFVSLFI